MKFAGIRFSGFISLIFLTLILPDAWGGEVVSLPPYQVVAASGVEFRFYFDPTTKKLRNLNVVSVTPRIAKQGIRVGDRVIAIEGKSISQLTIEELPSLRSEKTLIFTVERGGFRKRLDVAVTFQSRNQEIPNK